MKSFDLHIHTRLIFGTDKAETFADAVAHVGKSIYIITGGGSVVKLGYFDQVRNLLTSRGLTVHHFSGIEPNPHAQTIDKAAALVNKSGADAIIALGGGSVMDATKAIAALVHDNEPHIWPFVLGEPRRGELKGAIPIICIPTTAATASEVTMGSVISNPETKGKSVIGYPFLRPVISWLNPEFTTKVPAVTTADGASDILSHVFENYILGGNDSPLTDYYCEGIIRSVIETLPAVLNDPENIALRARLLWASDLALNGYQMAGRNPAPYVLHAIEHAMSGYSPDLAHGRGLATLYPAYFRWLWEKGFHKERFARLGRNVFNLSGDERATGMGFISQFEKWLKQNGLYQSTTSLGIPRDAFFQIADYATRIYGRDGVIPAADGISVTEAVEILEMTENQKPDN